MSPELSHSLSELIDLLWIVVFMGFFWLACR
jgi:hypothetical protein